jgi:hypothetical protein
MCQDASRLLATYKAALAAFDKVRCVASLVPEHLTHQEAAQAREDANVVVLRARKAYWKHVDEHGCRRMIASRPTIAGTITVHL